MKRFVSVWEMRKAFTLIEVMVAIAIISIVIMALLEMKGNSSYLFSELSTKVKSDQFSSFLLSNSDYGFENKKIRMERLLEEFEIDDGLRRELQAMKVKVLYQETEIIDLDEYIGSENRGSGIVFEVGKSIVQFEDKSASLLRVRVQ